MEIASLFSDMGIEYFIIVFAAAFLVSVGVSLLFSFRNAIATTIKFAISPNAADVVAMAQAYAKLLPAIRFATKKITAIRTICSAIWEIAVGVT